MKVAAAYENGRVFQHFGHSEFFKIYDIENGGIASSQVVETNCRGHNAMTGFLIENGVYAVLCGSIGPDAKSALDAAGIQVCSGAEGDCDQAVAAFMKGELLSAGVNCSKDEDGTCGCDAECGNCGGGCGGGCGCGCWNTASKIVGPNVGKTVKTHYVGTFNDGTQFDSSYDRGEPLEFVCGSGMMIFGYDKAVANMEVGQSIDVHLMPSEAYGEYDPNAVMEFEISVLRGSEELSVGDEVYLTDPMGRPILVRVTAKDDTTITLDANDQMAGKELNFHIELVEVK